MAIEYQVILDESKAGRVDKNGAPLECYTFTVNGTPSMKWFKPCQVEGLLATYYVERCIGRLKAGRSREAFGGPVLAMGAAGDLVWMEAPAPRGSVRRCEKRNRWVYTLDGREAEQTYPTEATAKEACACAAFMTRGKLGRLKEAVETFRACHGKGCEVRIKGRAVVAVAEGCGTRYAVGFDAAGVRFKSLTAEKGGE